jgi:tetratricopeptide (TPR) repeat protein
MKIFWVSLGSFSLLVAVIATTQYCVGRADELDSKTQAERIDRATRRNYLYTAQNLVWWDAYNVAMAAEDWDEAQRIVQNELEKRPDNHTLNMASGQVLFFAGDIAGSVKAFAKSNEDFPGMVASNWQNGISLYYADQFEAGRTQFVEHRTVNPNDVENSAWHYLCNRRLTDRQTARSELIESAGDARFPMMEVLELYRGKMTCVELMKLVEQKTPLLQMARQQVRSAAERDATEDGDGSSSTTKESAIEKIDAAKTDTSKTDSSKTDTAGIVQTAKDQQRSVAESEASDQLASLGVVESALESGKLTFRDRQALLYAYLYCGLLYEVEGDEELCKATLRKANALQVSNYMGRVGITHFKVRGWE